MIFNIATKVLKETTKCPKNFSCLVTGQIGDSVECKVLWTDGQDLLLLESEKPLSCPYRFLIGKGQICTCPTRVAIYKKYKL